jgi:hypothetical protein
MAQFGKIIGQIDANIFTAVCKSVYRTFTEKRGPKVGAAVEYSVKTYFVQFLSGVKGNRLAG